jgi:hypothetical protein
MDMRLELIVLAVTDVDDIYGPDRDGNGVGCE